MNKQDILNQIEWHLEETEGENASGTFDQGYKEGCYHCEALIEQLDEPQKVKVPKFVADWYEMNNKNLEYRIWKYIKNWDDQRWNDFKKWMDKNSVKSLEILTKMQYGYEVEEEPKYYIQLPETTWGTYLVKGEDNALFVWQNTDQGTPFTEQEIKAIDERYWPFAVPVEKV